MITIIRDLLRKRQHAFTLVVRPIAAVLHFSNFRKRDCACTTRAYLKYSQCKFTTNLPAYSLTRSKRNMSQLVSLSEKNSGAVNETLKEENTDAENVAVNTESSVEKSNPDDRCKDSSDDILQTKNEITDTTEDKNVGSTKHTDRRKRGAPKKLHMTFKRARIDSEQVLSQTHYRIEDGLRKVVPYNHKYNTFVKERWLGLTLRQIYSKEFRLYPPEFYAQAAKEGRLLLNNKRVQNFDVKVKPNDLISSLVHRHECPITAAPIEIVVDTDDFLVINKPSSYPIHPCGRFRHNSVIAILAKEFGKTALCGLHRLDRMTSGLLMFGKSKEVAQKVHLEIRNRLVEKEYVCRVEGDFSKAETELENVSISKQDGEDHPTIVVNAPLKVIDRKIGITVVSKDDDAKESLTIFKCLSTDGKSSVVSCKPKTGRTHQIRVHLQYLGYPIMNDVVYNNAAWGEERFRLGPITKPIEEVINGLTLMKKWGHVDSTEDIGKDLSVDENSSNETTGLKKEEITSTSEKSLKHQKVKPPAEPYDLNVHVTYRADCAECRKPLPDPDPNSLIMYLHALRYKGPDWEFSTALPAWASEDWIEPSTGW